MARRAQPTDVWQVILEELLRHAARDHAKRMEQFDGEPRAAILVFGGGDNGPVDAEPQRAQEAELTQEVSELQQKVTNG